MQCTRNSNQQLGLHPLRKCKRKESLHCSLPSFIAVLCNFFCHGGESCAAAQLVGLNYTSSQSGVFTCECVVSVFLWTDVAATVTLEVNLESLRMRAVQHQRC